MTQVHRTLEMTSSTASASNASVDAGENGVCEDAMEHPHEMNTASPSNVNEGDTAKKVYAVSVRWEREQVERARQSSEPHGPVRSKQPMLTFTIEDFHRYFCCCARRVGTMFFLLEKRDGTPIVVAGPCWPFCTFVTVPLIVVLSGLVGYLIVLNPKSGLPSWFAAIYFSIIAIVLVVLFLVSCRDPGLLERVTDEEAADNGWFWNEQVGSYRPAGAMYCRECQALIYDFDHLCPWTGTAIGKGNMKAFKTFVVSVNVLCYLSIGLVVYLVLTRIT
ncbi:hypothetical protein HJC23_006129 [Cyclotella cryptica]|uniref:Palmitoyltransferase n=1 Tax=Cyclotella cryptica TaxID=29204 RepID=A0ABD3QJV4_9STRA|eukprot:CCRYP_004611-RB/>CCRYP_004611-RB protein AED:0.09 eAED:0.09 QI:198/1/1/1/0.66/0.75/4/195/275